MSLTYAGQLEIDWARGVIYFHDIATGVTVLRICGLERLEKVPTDKQIDITLGDDARIMWSRMGGLAKPTLPDALASVREAVEREMPKIDAALEEYLKVKAELQKLVESQNAR